MGEFTGTVYYRQRGILVLTPTFVVPAEDRTLHRPVIRVMLAGTGTFALEFPDGRRVEARALMTSPITPFISNCLTSVVPGAQR